MSADCVVEGCIDEVINLVDSDTAMGEEDTASTSSDIEMDDEDNAEPAEEEIKALTPEEETELADGKKKEGNVFFVQKNYSRALQLYTEAIEICPRCAAYYGNRAATYMMLSRYQPALDDARLATRIDPTFVKGHLREAKCHLALGETSAAVRSYNIVLQLDATNSHAARELQQAKAVQQLESRAATCYDKADYRQVVYCMNRCIEVCPESNTFKVQKAECLALLKRYQESQEIANDLLRFDGMNADAMYVRGLCLYHQEHTDKAFQHFQQVLRLAPDHKKARDVYKKAKLLREKKDEGNAAFRVGRLQVALQLYTEALSIDPTNLLTNSKLYCNRATVSARLNKLDDAIEDCTQAIKLDETYTKAYLRRAKCYTDKERYEDAVRDYETVYKMDKSRENKQLLQTAKLELKKSQRKDYYKLLGVGKSATDDEIKKAYRKHALKHHPDRHSGSSDEVKNIEEQKFKDIGEAYSILADPKKKARYDSGQDLEEMDAGAGFHDIDPTQIFQAFFGGSGGGGGGGSGGFSFQQSQHAGGGGFPAGMQFQYG